MKILRRVAVSADLKELIETLGGPLLLIYVLNIIFLVDMTNIRDVLAIIFGAGLLAFLTWVYFRCPIDEDGLY